MLFQKVYFYICTVTLVVTAAFAQQGLPELTVLKELPTLSFSDASAINLSLQSMKNVAFGAQQFGLDLLHRISAKAEQANRDVMISPFSIWSLLLLMLEGSSGRTYDELYKTLRISVDVQILRSVFHKFSKHLNVNTSTVEVASLQALFTEKTLPISTNYTNVLKNYDANLTLVDFRDASTYKLINNETNKATRGLIKYAVQPQEIFEAKIFMLSSLFFKGQWKYPFNKSFTRTEPFYNEYGEIVANVEMMVQENNFVYASNINGLDGYVLELPYGELNRLSMIIILPKRGFTLHHIVGNLKKIGLSLIIDKLDASKSLTENDDIEVLMPKFTTTTDLILNSVLNDMGIIDLFDSTTANLSRMARNLFVNLCIHSTKIIVDEDGTTAGAITAGALINKATPPKFYLNKPFQYLIVDKATNLLLFAGQVRYPK